MGCQYGALYRSEASASPNYHVITVNQVEVKGQTRSEVMGSKVKPEVTSTNMADGGHVIYGGKPLTR